MDVFIPALLVVIAVFAAVGFGGIGYITGGSRDPFVRKFLPVAVILGLMGAVVILMSETRLGHDGSSMAFAWMYGTWLLGVALGRAVT
jgi:hypothetical protein